MPEPTGLFALAPIGSPSPRNHARDHARFRAPSAPALLDALLTMLPHLGGGWELRAWVSEGRRRPGRWVVVLQPLSAESCRDPEAVDAACGAVFELLASPRLRLSRLDAARP